MSNSNVGWDWFQEVRRTSPLTPTSDQLSEDMARAFARCFRERDGEQVLDHLRAVTLERSLGPNATDSQLRHLEGQRQLVSYILGQVERGRGTKVSHRTSGHHGATQQKGENNE